MVRLTPEAAQMIQRMFLDPREVVETLIKFGQMTRPKGGGSIQLSPKHVETYLQTGTELAIIGANDETLVLQDIITGSSVYSRYAIAVYDDDVETHGKQHGSAIVVGDTKMLEDKDASGQIGMVIVAARRGDREHLVEKFYYDTLRAPMAPIISEAAFVADSATLELACVICPGVTIGVGASLGLGCYVGYGATIGAFATIGPHADIGAGATVGPRARLEERVRVHPGASVGARGDVPKGLDFKGARVVKRQRIK